MNTASRRQTDAPKSFTTNSEQQCTQMSQGSSSIPSGEASRATHSARSCSTHTICTDEEKSHKRSAAEHDEPPRPHESEEDTTEVNPQDATDQQESIHDVDRNPSLNSASQDDETTEDELDTRVGNVVRAIHKADNLLTAKGIKPWMSKACCKQAGMIAKNHDDCWARLIAKLRPATSTKQNGYRKRGRPAKRWDDDINSYLPPTTAYCEHNDLTNDMTLAHRSTMQLEMRLRVNSRLHNQQNPRPTEPATTEHTTHSTHRRNQSERNEHHERRPPRRRRTAFSSVKYLIEKLILLTTTSTTDTNQQNQQHGAPATLFVKSETCHRSYSRSSPASSHVARARAGKSC